MSRRPIQGILYIYARARAGGGRGVRGEGGTIGACGTTMTFPDVVFENGVETGSGHVNGSREGPAVDVHRGVWRCADPRWTYPGRAPTRDIYPRGTA